MELRQVRYFEAVARHLHFTHAAEELYVAQPALSVQIQRLEAELGVPLFERSGRKVSLTDAGAAFLPAARRLLADVEETHSRLRDVAELRVGRVTLGSQQSLNASCVLPPLLAEFRRRNPGINLLITEEGTTRGMGMVSDGRLDMGLFHTEPGDDAPELCIEPIYAEELVFVTSSVQDSPGDHGSAGDNGLARTVASLAGEAFVAFSESATLRRTLTRICADAGFRPTIACECNALGSVRSLVSKGLGIGLLPLPSVHVPGPPVRVLPLETSFHRTIALVRSANRYQSAAARALTELLHNRLPPLAMAAEG